MKTNILRFTRTRAVRLLAVLLVTTTSSALAADKQVDLTVVGDGSGFKLKFLNSECGDRPDEKGCILVEHGNSPVLKWELDSASTQYWMLTRLQLSPDGEHWGDHEHPLADCTMDAFDLEERDRYTGDASTAMITANGRRLQIHDRNRDVCLTHYRIYAMPRVGGAAIDSDPVIDNRGGATQ